MSRDSYASFDERVGNDIFTERTVNEEDERFKPLFWRELRT